MKKTLIKFLVSSPYFKLQPPSILMISPCMELALPDAKNSVKSAISSGLLQRPIGILDRLNRYHKVFLVIVLV